MYSGTKKNRDILTPKTPLQEYKHQYYLKNKEKILKRIENYRKEHPEKEINKDGYFIKYWTDIREQFFNMYGDKCFCCGETCKTFLVLDHISGIYCIENLINGKRYIGQSENLQKRWGEHTSMLKSKTHTNKYLQSSFLRYGESAFIFKILIYCEPFELTKYEQFFVDFYTPEKLYNIRLECVDSNKGIK